ncbi:MAG: sigma-70 family RNA polymerase sigma factor [Candidatus Krumholzibacteriia bacterium]
MFEMETSNDRRNDPGLQHYLQTIGRYRLLTREQEYELARSIRQGDKEALDQLVNANLRFVVSVAKKFLKRGLSFLDLIAEGNVGLITAARLFDERREFRFISYAVWWIRQSIHKALAEKTNTVRLPINRVQQAQKMKHVARVLEQKHGRVASETEIAAALSIPLVKMNRIRAASRPLVSIDAGDNTGDHSLADTLADDGTPTPEQGYVERELRAEMEAALRLLSPRERSIVGRYYGLDQEEPASLETIGQEINLSRERVRQIRNRALAKIRATPAGTRLQAHL